MKDKIYNFWFSQKQKEAIRKIHRFEFTRIHLLYVTIDGKQVEYTECGEQEKPVGKWDDYVYLGKATMDDCEYK